MQKGITKWYKSFTKTKGEQDREDKLTSIRFPHEIAII